MRIVNIGMFDAAGVMDKMAKAMNSICEMRNIVFFDSGLDYTYDINIENGEEYKKTLEEADIIQIHPSLYGAFSTDAPIIDDWDLLKNYRAEKVIYLNGSNNLRFFSEYYKRRYKGYRILASTIDLCETFDAFYAPPILPIYDDLYMPLDFVPREKLVVHSPSDPAIKNTKEIEESCKKSGLRLLLLNGMSHNICLYMKKMGYLHFDHLGGYFGVSSLEAMSQGIPTIINLQHEQVLRDNGFKFTCITTTTTDLTKILKWAINNPDEIYELGRKSRNNMLEFFEPNKLAKRLLNFYESNQ